MASSLPEAGASWDPPPCFNCGIVGHFQVSCTNPPMSYLCKYTGHLGVLCPDCPVSEELMMYSHVIEGLGFFHNEVLEIPPPSPSLQAIVIVVGKGVASPEMIDAELNHLCRCVWDWQVTPTSTNAFTMIFPKTVIMGYCT